jgi:hypothetical protein
MGMKGLKNIIFIQQKGFLQRLRFVEVNDCGDVRTPFPAKLLQALKNLSSVDIESCKSLEEVFELGEVDEESNEEKELSLLSSLTTLLLIDLPELRCIWKGPTRHVSLQNLVHLNLNSFDKLTFIFTPSLAQSLPKLATLDIRYCGELKHVIREKEDEREIIPESLRFPRLKTIFIEECGKLEYVFPVSVSPSLLNLEEMGIFYAHNLKQIFYSGEGDALTTDGIIFIEECGKLEYVFPVSVSPSLLNLEEMGIFYAHNLKQIFYSGEGDALTTDGIIKFPRLRKLSLSSRSNFSFFGLKNFAAQLPSLQCLIIDGHEELGNLLAKLQVRPLYFSNNFFAF